MYILINSSYISCASRLKAHLQFKDFIISNLMNIPVGKVLIFFSNLKCITEYLNAEMIRLQNHL